MPSAPLRIGNRASLLLVLLLAAPGCAESPAGASPEGDGPFPVIRGRVVAAGGGDASGLRATWRARDGSGGDAAPVAADGSFEIRATRADPAGELTIDGDPPRAFHPFLYPLHADSVSDLTIVMVPRQWTIRAGEHAEQVVDTSLDPVVDDDARNFLYSYFWGQAEPRADPVRYLLDLAVRPLEAMPARVAFDRQGGANPVSPQDSAAVWGVLDRMEEVFGLDLFEPAVAEPAWWSEPWRDDPGLVPGVIRVVLEPPTWHGNPLGETAPISWDQELGTWADEGRFSAFRVRHRLLDGGLLIVGAFEPFQLSDGMIPWETVLTHEMLHVLGAGHTCRIPSPQGPCMRTAEPSPHDVAYMELLRETLRLEREEGTFLGIMPAVIGERRLLLGLPALPAVTGG